MKRSSHMKNLLIIFLAALFLSSCVYKNPELEQISNEKLVKQYFDHFNKHDWKKMAALYTETADFKDPSLGKGIIKQSREQVVKKYNALAETFPDLNDQIINIYPSGADHIVVEFVSKGTAPDKTKFELPICTIFTIKNGLITSDYTYFDNF